MRDGLRSAVAAVTFLTSVPIGRRTEIGARDLRRGTVFFPLVGAVVGAVTASVAWAAALALPPLPAAVLGVAAGVAVTGAMHLDGLADTADGVGAALSGGIPRRRCTIPGSVCSAERRSCSISSSRSRS